MNETVTMIVFLNLATNVDPIDALHQTKAPVIPDHGHHSDTRPRHPVTPDPRPPQ